MSTKLLYWNEKGFGENPGSAIWGAIDGTLANQTDLDAALGEKLESPIAISDVANLATTLAGKQDALVSGVGIKSLNNVSLLGSGDIEISGGSQVLKLSSNLTVNSTTENSIPDFTFSLEANASYKIFLSFSFRDIQPVYFYLDFPSGCTGNCVGESFDHNSASGYAYLFANSNVLTHWTRVSAFVNRNYTGVGEGVVRVYSFADIILNTSQSGTFTVKTKISNAGNIAMLLKDSYLSISKL
ncbi:MAG TPA: hypothetical protein DCS19_04195 [Flavobacterium sp.]|nr:hypothetical protein [Flavobacterium sp.]